MKKTTIAFCVLLCLSWIMTERASATADADRCNPVAALDIHGDRATWSEVEAFPADTSAEPGIGPFDVDWRRVTMAHGADRQMVFVRYELNAAADFSAYPAFYNLFIDADNNRATGYVGSDGQLSIGADYLIQGANVFAFSGGSVQTAFGWELKGAAQSDIKDSGKDIAIAIPMLLIGAPSAFRFVLLGDNVLSGNTPDYYPDNASAGVSGGFFEYSTAASTESADADTSNDRASATGTPSQ